jgi:uncharacterized protein
MIYLLDVNALLALIVEEHEFHERTLKWVKKAVTAETVFATCSITELRFLRVLLQLSDRITVPEAQKLLKLLKSSRELHFQFLVDDHGAEQLPEWVKRPKQVTDGHLAALAKAHGAILATLDERTRSAYVVPR